MKKISVFKFSNTDYCEKFVKWSQFPFFLSFSLLFTYSFTHSLARSFSFSLKWLNVILPLKCDWTWSGQNRIQNNRIDLGPSRALYVVRSIMNCRIDPRVIASPLALWCILQDFVEWYALYLYVELPLEKFPADVQYRRGHVFGHTI